MELHQAYGILTANDVDHGRFYGSADGVDLGAGLILKDVAFPTYDTGEGDFVIGEGVVYVMSHECDLDQNNDRPFNDHGVICPIVPLDHVLQNSLAHLTEDQLMGFLDAVGKKTIERVLFVPAIGEVLPNGGFLYFGMVTNTHVTELSKPNVERCSAVSMFGLRAIDMAFEQAFRKPKAQRLPMAPRQARV